MKLVLALAVLATSAASMASSRDIYDIMYLPSAGTTYGFSTGEIVTAKAERDTEDAELDGYVLTQTLGHSISDRLSIQGTLNYADREVEEGSEKRDFETGISDPTISARFRMMDENSRWDLIGGVSINMQDRKIEKDSDSNNSRGGHDLFIGTQFGGKTESFQWAVLGQLIHHLESETEYETSIGDMEFKNEAYNSLFIRGDILNKLAEKSLLRSHVSVKFDEEFEDDDTPPLVIPARTEYEIGTEYQHVLSQDLLLRAGIAYGSANQLIGQIDEETTWTYRFGANYQF